MRDDVLSVFTRNIVANITGDEERINSLLIYVRDGSKLSNSAMFEKLGFITQDVVSQITRIVMDKYVDLDKEAISLKVAEKLNEMTFHIENQKVYFDYKWDELSTCLELEVDKETQNLYNTYEVLQLVID